MDDGGGGGDGGGDSSGDVGSTTHPVANLVPTMVGFGMVRGGKAAHPHWRHGKGKKHAKRLYENAMRAHAHTRVKP